VTKLKLGPLADDKPVKLSVELPAGVHRNLIAYAEALGQTTGQPVADPAKLIVPMIERFMATDRAFAKIRRQENAHPEGESGERSLQNQGLFAEAQRDVPAYCSSLHLVMVA
jgi:hypothetical protein